MLRSLRINNIAIIDSIDVEFTAGLNLMTGETGAGKSIIIDSLGLALGQRARSGIIGDTEKAAEVVAEFSWPDNQTIHDLLSELAIPDEGSLLLRRRITASGNSRAFINDVPVNLNTLAGLGEQLISIHGQGEGDQLLTDAGQLEILDDFAQLTDSRNEIESVWEKWRTSRNELTELTADLEKRRREKELLQFQIAEIEKANLSSEDEKEVIHEHSILQNARHLKQASGEVYYAMYEDDDSVVSRLSQLETVVEDIAAIDDNWSSRVTELQGIRYQLQEIANDLNRYSESVEHDPERLTEIEERLEVYSSLQKKYGRTTDEVLDFLDKSKHSFESIEADDEHLEVLQKTVNTLENRYNQLGKELSKRRTDASEPLARAVEQHLADLAMDKARLEIDCTEHPRGRTKTGIDHVMFKLQANPGSSIRPLANVASGGEQSRIMLALKSVILGKTGPSTLIFDEIDAGVGGKVAEFIGRKLNALAQKRQILCITHLAQVAVYADSHYVIDKDEAEGKTRVVLRNVLDETRVDELARMLGGELITEKSKSLAKELVDDAIAKRCNND